jgi:hypothetical protein
VQASLSAVVGAPVTVKGRRAEGIGGLGRSEGIACLASALVESRIHFVSSTAPGDGPDDGAATQQTRST